MSNFTANSQWFKDYVESIEVAQFNKERPKRTFKNYQKAQTMAGRIENERFMNDFMSSVPLVPEYDYTDQLADAQENLLGMFRLNFAEQTERDAKRDARREELATKVTDEQKIIYDITETNIINDLKEATKKDIPLWKVMNPDDFVWKDTGEATTRLWNTADGYSMSQYTTFTTGDTYKSWFGASRRVKMGAAQRLQLNDTTADIFRDIAEKAKIAWDFEGPIAQANGLTIKEYIDEAVAENPDQWWFWRNIGDIFYTTEKGMEIDGTLGPWNSEMLAERLLSMNDENWTDEGGDRDKLLAILSMDESEIGATGIIKGNVRRFIAENPTILEDLKTSNNGWQFIAALNKRKSERVIGNFLTENSGSYGTAGFMNLLGYGFTTDPAIAIDIAATVGLTVATGGGYLGARIAAGGLQFGTKIKFGLAIANATKKAKNFTKLVKIAQDGRTVGRYKAASVVAKALQVTGEGVQFTRRLLPTQIVSELIFPSIKFLRHSRNMKTGDKASDAATSWWKYLKNENYLGNNVGQRMLHRSIGGAMEGVVWGTIEYGVMEDYQDRTNSLIFGNDAAAALALDRYRSGAYAHMVMFGVAFGGLGGPLIGETFTQVGKIPKGLMIGGIKMNRWADQIISVGGQEAMGYGRAPFAKRFGARIVKAAGTATTWVGGGNHYTIEQHYLMYKALSQISPEEVARIRAADDGGIAMTKTLQDIQDRISKYHWAATDAGLDIKEAFSAAEAAMEGLEANERTSMAFIKQVEDHLEAQEIVLRGQAGFRSRVKRLMMEEFQKRMLSGQDVGIMEKAMADADPNNPPVDAEVSGLTERTGEIQGRRRSTSEEHEAVKTEQTRRAEGEEPEGEVRTVEEVEGDLAEQRNLRDEETIAAKTEENNKAKDELKELKESRPRGKSKSDFRKENPRVVELETTVRETNKFLKDVDEAKDIPIADVQERIDVELEAARKDVRNLTDEELDIRKSELEVILGELDYEFDAEAFAFWQANPDKFVEYVSWFRKKVLEERLDGDTPNATGVLPLFAAIDSLEVDGAVNMIQIFAPETFFTRDELIRVRRQLNTEDQRFITAALNRSQDGEFDLTKVEAQELATRIKNILVEEAINKDYTHEEMRFMTAIFNEPGEENIAKAFASTRVETYVNHMMIDAAKNNKVLTADDLILYNQDPELVVETFVQAKQDLAKLVGEVRNGNYTSILSSQGKHVLDTLGEGIEGYKKSGKGITNEWKRQFLAKHFGENQEFTRAKADMLDVFDVNDDAIGPHLQQPARTSEQMDLVKAKIKDLLEDVVTRQADKIKKSEIRARLKKKGYAAQREKVHNAYVKFAEAGKKENNQVKTAQEKAKFIELRKKLLEKRESINKAVEAEWEAGQIQVDWIARQSKRLDVQYRPNFAHARPLVKVLSMLQAHLLGKAKWRRDSLSGFYVDTTISRRDLISILETAEEGYGFIANIDDIAIGARVGDSYDGQAVMQVLLDKLKTTDNTLGTILSAGFEKNLGIHFGKKLPYATDVFGSRGDLRNLMTSLEGQLEGKQAYARNKGANGEYSGNRGEANSNEGEWNASFNNEFITRLGYITQEGSQRAKNLLAALDKLSPNEQIAQALKFINEFIPRGQEKLRSFSQLGGGTDAIDWVGPKRAAQAVLSALSSERPYANKVAESYVVMGTRGRPERARRLSNIDEDGIYIQHDSDPIIQRNYERATADHAMNWLLKKLDNPELTPEGRKDIYNHLQAWLEDFPEQAILNQAVRAALPQQGLSFVPRWMVTGPDADIIGRTFGEGIEGQIKYNQAMSKAVTPALMAAIHDAIFVGLPTMMTKSGDAAASPNWNYKVGDDHVLRGIGFGFQTMIARKGTFEDALNHVHEIMYGYKGLVEEARASYNKMEKTTVEEVVGKTFDTNDEFVGWMAQEFPKLDTARKEVIIKELFGDAMASAYMDADSSGSNIMLALVMGQETDFGNLWATIRDADPDNSAAYNAAHSEAVINAYKHVESYVLDRLEAGDFKQKAGLEEIYKDLGEVFRVLKDEGLSKTILKGPVMTDSYGIGVAKMKETIIDSFGDPDVRETLIKKGLFTEEDYDAKIHKLSETLATLLGKSVDGQLGGWIKQSLFEKGSIDNRKLGEILNDWRRTESGQRVRTGDEERSIAESNSFMGEMTSGETAANFKADSSEEISMFDAMFNEVQRQISVLAEITGDVNKAKEWVNSFVNIVTEDLKSNRNVEKLINEGKFAEAQREIDIAFNKIAEESVMVKALNSYMAQGYGFDEAAFRGQLEAILGSDKAATINNILGRLNPLARQAIKGQMFRQLALSAETRSFVKSDFDQIADKILRLESEESPLGLGKLVMESLSDEDIRERTLLQAIKELSEIYDLEKLGLEIEGEKFKSLTWEDHFKQWEKDSETGLEIRAAAIDALKNVRWRALIDDIDRRLAENTESSDAEVMSLEAQKEAIEQTLKMLARIIDSTNEARPTDAAKRLELTTGSSNVINTGRMPGLLGALPSTTTRRFEGAPIPILRMAQLEQTAEVRQLRSLEKGAEAVDTTRAVFSDAELSRPLTPEDLADVQTYKGSMYDVPLAARPIYGMEDSPSPQIAAELLGAELANFANQVGGKAKKYLDSLQFEKLYNTHRHWVAEQEGMKAESIYMDIAQTLSEKRQALLRDRPPTDDLDTEAYLSRSEEYTNLKLELNKAQDNALMVRNEVLAIDGSWAKDVDERVWSVMSMSGETLETVSNGRTWAEAINKTALDNERSGNLIAWLAPPGKTPGEVVLDGTNTGKLRYEDKAVTAMLPRAAHSVDASAGLYMTNYIQVTGWHEGLKSILKRDPSSNEITVFVRWADAKARIDVDELNKLSREFGEFVAPYKDLSSQELTDIMGRGQGIAAAGFRDANAAIAYMAKPVLREQVKESLKAQLGDDFEAKVIERTGKTLEQLMSFERKLTSDKTTIFVNPLGVVISPHKVVGDGIVNLTMQERVLSLQGIQNQTVVDRMRLATMFDRKLPMNSELSSRMAGYDPFTKFNGMTIDKARRNAAVLTDALEILQARRSSAPLSVAIDRRNIVRRGTLTEGPMKFMKFTDAMNEEGARDARMLLAENTLDVLPLSDDSLKKINALRNTFDPYDEADWATGIQVAMMVNKDSAHTVFKQRILAEERLAARARDIDPEKFDEQFEIRWEKVKPIIDELRNELNRLNRDSDVVATFLERNDVFFGETAVDYTTHETFNSLYAQKIKIERAVQMELLNRTLVPDNTSFDREVQFIKPIADLNGIIPRSDGNQIKPNTIDARMRDYPKTDAHLMLTHRLDTFVGAGILNKDQASVLKLAFWDYDIESLGKIFDPMKTDSPLRFDVVDGVDYVGKYEQTNKAYTDGVVHRISLLRGMSSKFADEGSLGPAAVVLEEIGHALGHKLTSETQIKFIERVKNIEMDNIEATEKFLYGEGGPKNQKRLEQLKEDYRRIKEMEIPENEARRTELFGAMFAMSALHKAKNQWDTITDGAPTQEALSNAHSIIKSLGTLAEISGVEDIHGKSLFGEVEDTLRHSINLGASVNRRNRLSEEDNIHGETTDPRHVDVDVARRNEDARRSQVDQETDDLIEQIRNPDTGVIEISLLGDADKMSVTVRDQVIARVMEGHVKRSTTGSRVATPFADYVAQLAFGKLTNNQIARYSDLLASPFGMRQFAFATDGEVPLAAAILHLFNGADSQSYFTSGAFQDAMPTIQGLGLYLRGEFEKVIPALALLKGENMSKGPLGPSGGEASPWALYSTLWREMVMDYQGPVRAKEVLVAKLNSMKNNDPDFAKFLGNKKKSDAFLDTMVQTADVWANPQTGLWTSIVDAMVQAGMVKESKRNDLIANAAYPIKFKDSIFKNQSDLDGDTPRRELRRAIVEVIRGRMEHSEDVDIDILQIALADVLPTPSQRKSKNLASYENDLPSEIIALLKSPEIKGNVDILLSKIKRGDIKLRDLGDDVRSRYDAALKNDDLIGNQDPRRKAMLLELSEEFRSKLAKSQRTSTLDLQPTTAAEFVANRYMSNIGSSSYSFAGDAFLSPKQLWGDPRIAKFLDDDPISLLDSVKRGTAAQAFDRATYSNYFGIKGFGMKDLIELYKKVGNGENGDHEFKMMFMTKDMQLDEHKRTLTHDERQKFKAGIDHIDSMYKYSVGTLSTLDNPHAAPFLNIINIVSELGTALSIAPRLAIATAIEETPMSIGSVLKDNLLGARKEMQAVLTLAKSTQDIHDTLEGLGHITSSVMHQSAALAAKMGDDGTGSYGVTDKKKIKQIYKFLSLGMNRQVMAARSLGAMQYVNRLDSIFSNLAGDISFTDTARGKDLTFMRQGTGGFHVNADEIYLRLQEEFHGDFTNITRSEFSTITRDMGINEETSRDILEAIKVGLFQEDKYQFFRNMWLENRQDILKSGIPFDKLRLKITSDYDQHVRAGKDGETVRTRKLQALNGIRELVFTASTKFAKQPSLSTQPLGARNAGVLATFFTRLTTYASSSANTLRRAMFVGPSTFAAAFTAHMITGWLYYKLIQLQGFRTIEEMKQSLREDPMTELADAVMSVPFLGANQMVMSVLISMMRGERPVNSKPYDIAALNAMNSLLQLPVRVTKGVGDLIKGDWEKGSANIAQRLPVPHAWALAIALRNAGAFEDDIQINRLSPKYKGQRHPQPMERPTRPNATKDVFNTPVLEQQIQGGKPQVTPEHTDPQTGMTTPSSVEQDRVNELISALDGIQNRTN